MKNSRFKGIRAVLAVFLALSVIGFAGCSSSQKSGKDIDALNAIVNTATDYDEAKSDYRLSVDVSKEMHDISDLLFGIFFEDINFSADGGLYAEKVANRSFEFTELAEGDQLYHWSAVNGANAEVKINDAKNALNENNTNYLVLKNGKAEPAGIENKGFLEGMSIEKDAEYKFSLYAKAIDGYKGGVTVRLAVNQGSNTPPEIAAEAKIDKISDKWEKYELTLKSSVTASETVTLQVLIDGGSAAFDMISLFPKDTYKGRENGLRKDLAEKLEELHPKFIRFPGGCAIEGENDDSDYSWKNSVGAGKNGLPLLFNGTYGDVAARKQDINIWTDKSASDDPWPGFMSYGLGFYEYFQLAEDIGALGVPVLNCGLYCQSRGMQPVDMDSARFREYIQDMLDLVEFCRGGENTVWGKVRIALGHKAPFELKYICIGNENFGNDYFVRYQAFRDAFDAAKKADPKLYDGINLIYSAGLTDGTNSSDYLLAYQYAKEHIKNGNAEDFAGAIDHHYYKEPDWLLQNADYYDEANYRRSVNNMTDTIYGGAINVFLGEYASLSNTLKSALAEAAYMTGLERNGDIVRMATYAPLFSSVTARHWAPNLIWYNNAASMGSINYYIQKLFSDNTGKKLLSSSLEGAEIEEGPLTGKVGVGTWNTSAEFDNVKIVNNDTGEVLGEDDFSSGKLHFNMKWDTPTDGDWEIDDGRLAQTSIEMDYSETGSVAYFGEEEWTNYTYTVDAVKTDGDEGFIIPFAVKDKNTNYFWNIGGWNNTLSCLQSLTDGVKTGQVAGTVKDCVIETDELYKLKIEVSGTKVKCYINDELYVDFDADTVNSEAYQVVSTDDSGDVIIKLVNVTGEPRTFAIDIAGGGVSDTAKAYQVAGENLEDENVFGEPEKSVLKEFDLNGIKDKFNFTVPKYSATAIRIAKAK